MNREVFQSNKIVLFGIIGAVFVGAIIAYIQVRFPIWILPIAFAVGGLIVFSSLKTKIIIEDGKMRYEKLGGGDEVDLKNIAQIVIREVETIVDKSQNQPGVQSQGSDVRLGQVRINHNEQNVNQERQVERIVYVFDLEGRTVFSFPASLIRFTQRSKFREAIHMINPAIEVF